MHAIIAAMIAGLFGPGGYGTSAMALLKIGQGPTAAALGEAYTSIADDASAVYWNPAGLGRMRYGRLGVSHHEWFQSVKDEAVQLLLPTGEGMLGLGLLGSTDPGIQEWDESNMPGDTFMTWQAAITAGYGMQVAGNWWFGGALKGLYENLHDVRGMGGACDLGLITRPAPWFNAGVAARNAGAMFYNGDLEMLPFEAAVGASAVVDRFRATLDVVLPYDGDPNVRAGVEVEPVRDLAVRLGYRTGPADIWSLGPLAGLTAGMGLKVGSFEFGYAFTPYGELGMTHRAGIQVLLGRRGRVSYRVKVIDARTLRPLEVELRLEGIGRGSARTRRDGEYDVERLPEGTLVITAERDGYLPSVESVYVHPDRVRQRVMLMQPVDCGGVWGTMRDAETRKPVMGLVTYEGPQRGQVAVDSMKGSFAIKSFLPGRYYFTAYGPGEEYGTQSCTLDVVAGRLVGRDFEMVRRKPGLSFELVMFSEGSADIGAEFEPLLDSVIAALAADSAVRIEVAGHADGYEMSLGKFRSRWELSLARAEAVRERIILTIADRQLQIANAPERVTARGYAEHRALAASDTPEGRARNRSVEFIELRR